ncbi:MAG TPA: hypothetical protein VEJ86_02405, partial [Candidatus Binataceae bacterium]|nr:hypothetical protein [Candidatus Binataceae bacterium]
LMDWRKSAERRIKTAISKQMNREAAILRNQLRPFNSPPKGKELRVQVKSRATEFCFYCESLEPPEMV